MASIAVYLKMWMYAFCKRNRHFHFPKMASIMNLSQVDYQFSCFLIGLYSLSCVYFFIVLIFVNTFINKTYSYVSYYS